MEEAKKKGGSTGKKSDAQPVEAPADNAGPAVIKSDKNTYKPKDVDPNQIVTVRNGFQGPLIYVSKKTGETFKWEDFGDEQDMELSELKNARNSNKRFFINNWFMFDEPWVIDYLGMKQYYKNAVSVDSFDDIFNNTPDRVAKIISDLSAGQKESVAYRARQLIAEGEIDSIKTISVLEEHLGIKLVER